jgi:hypothetical protein
MSKTITVDVEVDLDDFDIGDLIYEVVAAGYTVLDEDEVAETLLTRDEIDYLIEKSSFADIGTIGYFANEKLRQYRVRPVK